PGLVPRPARARKRLSRIVVSRRAHAAVRFGPDLSTTGLRGGAVIPLRLRRPRLPRVRILLQPGQAPERDADALRVGRALVRGAPQLLDSLQELEAEIEELLRGQVDGEVAGERRA